MYYTASAKNPRRTHFRRPTSLQQYGETNTMYNNVFVETVKCTVFIHTFYSICCCSIRRIGSESL